MSVRMKRTRAKVGATRSHHRLPAARLSKCANCGAQHVRHTMCTACGMYRGKQVVDVAKKVAKRTVRTARKTGAK